MKTSGSSVFTSASNLLVPATRVDYYGRPWAKNWEKTFEQGLEKPDTELPAEILDIFK